MRRALVVLGLGVAGLVAARRFRDWGATKGECGAVLPGDELIPDPADVVTRAVTVSAPPGVTWRCAAEAGAALGGIVLPANGRPLHRSVVLWRHLPITPWDGICALHVVPHGSHRCRLIARSRIARGSRLRWLVNQLLDPVALVATRRLLLDVKLRAEHGPIPVRAAPPAAA